MRPVESEHQKISWDIEEGQQQQQLWKRVQGFKELYCDPSSHFYSYGTEMVFRSGLVKTKYKK